MEAFTRLQPKDAFQVELYKQVTKPREREDKFVKKQKPTPQKQLQQAKRNTLPNANNSLVPVNPNIYENLEHNRSFSLPRVRQLWCTDPNCQYNSGEWTERHQSHSRPSSTMSGYNRNGIGAHSNEGYHPHRENGSYDDGYYDDNERDEGRSGQKLRRSDFSPAVSGGSNSTVSTGLSSRNRSDADGSSSKSDPASVGQFLPNLEFQHSMRSTNSRSLRSSNAQALVFQNGVYPPTHPSQYCHNCSGVIPLSQLETIPEMSSFKTENGLWNFNNFHYPLQRDSSIGGFTLNGQPRVVKKSKLAKFCSSHKIALVVSTFSLLVTIALIITLYLMKKKGMMEPM